MMKQVYLILIVVLMLGFQDISAQKEFNQLDSVSYSLGVMFAKNIQEQGFSEIDLDLVLLGLKEATRDTATINAQQANQVLSSYIQSKRSKEMNKNLIAGQQFLAENATKDSVVILESGLQYKVLTEGTGEVPTASDKVTVHYHGTLIDGTVFDSSIQRGTPATFGVTQVIAGWVEALQLMPVGSKWRLFIPSDLAYGSRGAGATIKPNSTLIFDVELMEIVK